MTMSKKIYLKDIPVDQLEGVKIKSPMGGIGTIQSAKPIGSEKQIGVKIDWGMGAHTCTLSSYNDYEVVSNFWNPDLV